MHPALDTHALGQLFRDARTHNAFGGEVSDETLHQLYALVKFGPTTANTCPARFVFVRSQDDKARLALELDAGNRDKTGERLTERAKILYTEAVIAESYSDFKTAHAKFTEIMKMAPDGSLYYQRAQRKLQSYLNFHAEETP